MKDTSYCELLSSTEKRALASEVIKKIKQLRPPGRFLKKDRDGTYTELTEAETLKKTKQALRDCNRPDREGYASQVAVPQGAARRVRLTVQEIAQRRMDEEKAKQRKQRESNKKEETPTFSSTASSRPSRRGISAFSGSAERFPNHPTRNTRNTAPMDPPMEQPYQPPMEADAVNSTTNAWPMPSTVTATPAVRPPVGPTPVTRTPNASHYPFLQNYNQDLHSAMNHPPSNRSINANHLSSFNNQYTPRNDYSRHHPEMVQSIEPSPMVRVRSTNARNDTNIFDEQPDPLLEGWDTRANLFPQEDALDTTPPPAVDNFDRMAANVDFNFEIHNDVAVHRNNRDLGI